jgi:replicative DNA helicase
VIHDHLANERIFIGCLLRSPFEFWQINDIVTADQFSIAHHRDIFTAIRDLSERGKVVTTTSLQTNLPEEYEELGPTIALLMALKESANEAGSATDYAPFLAERSALKKLETLSIWLNKETKKNDRPAEDISAEASLKLHAIMAVSSPMRPKAIGEVASAVARHANSAQMGEVVSGLNTGISSLDEILGLMLGADLGAIIASQGDGKSALAAQIGIHAAKSGRPVLFVQMEMSDEQMAARELAAASGVSVNQIHEGAFDAFQWEEIVRAETELRAMPFHIIDAEEMTVRQVKAQALGMQRTVGLSLVIIDQLDKLKAEGKPRDRFERMAEISRDLKKLAKFLKVPVIVLAQRTRGAQRRDDPTPDVLDADAPSLERDCDWIIGLWQRKNWLRRNKPDGRSEAETTKWESEMWRCKDQAEVICLKRRRGKAFEQRTLTFDGPTMRFRESS